MAKKGLAGLAAILAMLASQAAFGQAPQAPATNVADVAGEVDGRPDRAKALAWYAQAARVNHPQGLYAMAVAFDRGEGGGVDRVTAWGWLKIAERLGHADAGSAVRAIEAQLTPEDRTGVAAKFSVGPTALEISKEPSFQQ